MMFKYFAMALMVTLVSAEDAHHRGHGGRHGRNNLGGKNATRVSTSDAAKSTCLDPSVIQKALLSNGLGANGTEAGQVASLTSPNNFINFCKGQTLTNGAQVRTGSCNPTPMGQIAAVDKQPAVKFTSPKNLDIIPANKSFNISMKVINLETGHFSNAQTTYYAAPQQLNANGLIIGHGHITVQPIQSLTDTTIPDPTKFTFFKGLNEPDVDGILSANVAAGLPAGVYRISSITTTTNHAAVLTAAAQKGSTEDSIYITVSDQVQTTGSSLSNQNGGQNNGNKGGNGGQGKGKGQGGK